MNQGIMQLNPASGKMRVNSECEWARDTRAFTLHLHFYLLEIPMY